MDDVRADVTELDGTDETAARELLAAAAATVPSAPQGAYETRGGVIAAGLVAEPRKRRTRRWVERLVGLALTAAIGFGVRAALDAIFPGPPSPISVVNAAIAKTAAESYSATVTLNVSSSSGPDLRPTVESGGYDPIRRVGDLTAKATSGTVQYRRADGYTYVRSAAGTWTQQAVTVPYPVIPSVLQRYGAAGVLFADPRALIPLPDWETDMSTANPAAVSGPGWHGTGYVFNAIGMINPNSGGQVTITIDGTKKTVKGDFVAVLGNISVDSSGRIRELVETIVPSLSATTYTLNVTYSHYGIPVQGATPPTAHPAP